MGIYRYLLIILLVAAVSAGPALADMATIVDQQNSGMKVMEEVKAATDTGKWLPVPIPVSNPTVGSGLTLGLLYLHPKKEDALQAKAATSGIGAMYTDSESWFTGAFHDDNWFDDRLRLTALIGAGEFNIHFYGTNAGSIFQKYPVKYSIKPTAYMWQVLVEPFEETGWYLGVKHLVTTGDVLFKTSNWADFLPDIEKRVTTSGLSAVINYDSRNDSYYPTNGSYFASALSFDDPDWGSDFRFEKLTSFYNHYFPVTTNGVIAVKADLGLVVNGKAPFYMLPSLNMRGFATGRYCDDAVVSGHLEWRHKIFPRWGYVLSYEAGLTHDKLNGISNGTYAYSVGGGIRWQVLKAENLHLGVDYGMNEDDYAVCIQVGERF